MSTRPTASEPYPFGSALASVLAFVATIATSFAVMPLKGGKLQYLYSLINQRGPVIYLILLCTYAVAIALLRANAHQAPLSNRCLITYPIAGLIPLLLGIVGTAQGFGAALVGLAAPDRQLARVAVGFGVSIDTMLLGTLATIFLLFGSLRLFRQTAKRDEAMAATTVSTSD